MFKILGMEILSRSNTEETKANFIKITTLKCIISTKHKNNMNNGKIKLNRN